MTGTGLKATNWSFSLFLGGGLDEPEQVGTAIPHLLRNLPAFTYEIASRFTLMSMFLPVTCPLLSSSCMLIPITFQFPDFLTISLFVKLHLLFPCPYDLTYVPFKFLSVLSLSLFVVSSSFFFLISHVMNRSRPLISLSYRSTV